MLGSFPISIMLGVLLGFFAGLGVGGGSILILWLTVILGMDPQTARGINLLFFIPCAITASIFRWKQGDIPWKQILPGICFGCLASAVFSIISPTINTITIRKLFGGLLIITGLRELCYTKK